MLLLPADRSADTWRGSLKAWGLVLGAQALDAALPTVSLSRAPGQGQGQNRGTSNTSRNFSAIPSERGCSGEGAAREEHRTALARRSGKQEGGALGDGAARCREPQSAAGRWGSAPATDQAPSQRPGTWGATPWPPCPSSCCLCHVHTTSQQRGRPWFRDTVCAQCQARGGHHRPAPDASIGCADTGCGPGGATTCPSPPQSTADPDVPPTEGPNPRTAEVRGGRGPSWAFFLVLEAQPSEQEGPGGNREAPHPSG